MYKEKVALTLVKGRSSSVMRSNRDEVWCIMRERLATSLWLLYGRVALCTASNGLLARLFERLCIVVFFVRERGLRGVVRRSRGLGSLVRACERRSGKWWQRFDR
jgi:hypothetical protein